MNSYTYEKLHVWKVTRIEYWVLIGALLYAYRFFHGTFDTRMFSNVKLFIRGTFAAFCPLRPTILVDEYTSDLCFPLKRACHVTAFQCHDFIVCFWFVYAQPAFRITCSPSTNRCITWAHPPEPDVLAVGFALFCWSSSSRPNGKDFDESDFLELPFPLYRLPCDDLVDPEMLSL